MKSVIKFWIVIFLAIKIESVQNPFSNIFPFEPRFEN